MIYARVNAREREAIQSEMTTTADAIGEYLDAEKRLGPVVLLKYKSRSYLARCPVFAIRLDHHRSQ